MSEPSAEIRAALREAKDCLRQGNYAQAERIYLRIISLAPLSTHYLNLGVIQEAQAKYEQAAIAYAQAMKADPAAAEPYYCLGNLLRDRGRTNEAFGLLQRAVQLKPDYGSAHLNLGKLLLDTGRIKEARFNLEKAVALEPEEPYAHNNLGNALKQDGLFPEAVECYRRAIQLKPNYPEALSNLGSVQLELGEFDDAVGNCRKALELEPKSASRHFKLGNVYAGALRVREALACYERAISLDPGNAGYHWNYSVALLLEGDYARGWNEYESRWQGCPELQGLKPTFTQPQWAGEDISGKTILIHREQGLGDVIQFIRYAPLLAQRSAKVVVLCHPSLVRLLRTVEGVTQIATSRDDLPHFDIQCSLLSLPLAFRTEIGTIPCEIPYIQTDAALVGQWRTRFGVVQGLKVGLVWGGWSGNRLDSTRSIKLAEFNPLARVPGVRFYSLQKGEHALQAGSPPPGLQIEDWTSDIDDFADTAAMMKNLDLVITVDTATTHLAGALGKRVWLLNRYQSEWRWLLERDDSPWYPTMRIFRQQAPGDWRGVLESVANALKREVAAMR